MSTESVALKILERLVLGEVDSVYTPIYPLNGEQDCGIASLTLANGKPERTASGEHRSVCRAFRWLRRENLLRLDLDRPDRWVANVRGQRRVHEARGDVPAGMGSYAFLAWKVRETVRRAEQVGGER